MLSLPLRHWFDQIAHAFENGRRWADATPFTSGRVVSLKPSIRRRAARLARLGLEVLEDRTVLSTLFVDPSGRTPSSMAAYTMIQAAVNAASPGDTIQVDPGIYSENVNVPANLSGLTLDGAQMGVNPVGGRSGPESILNGDITITASGVTFDGFTVTANAQWAIEIGGANAPSLPATNCLIQNNIVHSSVYGIQVGAEGGPSTPQVPLNCVVRSNLLQCGNADIPLFNTANNTVQGNAIPMRPSQFGSGIDIYYSDNNSVLSNEIDDAPTPTPPSFFSAIRLRGAHGNLVQSNTGSGNGQPAVQEAEGSGQNTFQYNNFAQVPGNLIVNGDFERGNTGFTTEYTYSPGSIGPAASYDVLPNPRPAHSADTASYGDHSSGEGLMMAINGAVIPNVLVWGENVPVIPNTSYCQ